MIELFIRWVVGYCMVVPSILLYKTKWWIVPLVLGALFDISILFTARFPFAAWVDYLKWVCLWNTIFMIWSMCNKEFWRWVGQFIEEAERDGLPHP